jgi:uncharacterized Zn-finger protein
MAIPFVNYKSLEARNCQKCGVSFSKPKVRIVITSWSGKVICWDCEKKFRAFIHLG